MSETRYKVILSNEPLPPNSIETLEANLAALFKLGIEEVRKLLADGELCIRRNLTQAEADRYLAALQNAGAVCRKETELTLLADGALEKQIPSLEKARIAEEERLAQQEAEREAAALAQKKAENLAGSPHNPYAAPKAAVLTAGEGYAEVPNPYSMHGRIGRLRYLAWTMVVTLASAPALVFCAWIGSKIPPLGVILIIVAMVVLLLFNIRISAQRLHDIGLSAWFLLCLLVPVVGGLFSLVLLIMPGSRHHNGYGPPPAPNNTAIYVLASLWLLPIIFVLLAGILRAVMRLL